MGIFNFVFRTFDEVRFKSWDVALLVPACCYKYKMRIINCAIEINAYLLAWKVAHVIPPPKQKKTVHFKVLRQINILPTSSLQSFIMALSVKVLYHL